MAIKTKEIDPIQYAKWYGCHKSYIHKILQEGKISRLPFVKRVKRFSRFYTLIVDIDVTENSFTYIKNRPKFKKKS